LFSGNFQMKIFMIFIVHAWCSSFPEIATTLLPFSYETGMCKFKLATKYAARVFRVWTSKHGRFD
jgi:hypothetical protein